MSQKIWIFFPVFLNHGQLDFFNGSDSIADYLTSIFPKNFKLSKKNLQGDTAWAHEGGSQEAQSASS